MIKSEKELKIQASFINPCKIPSQNHPCNPGPHPKQCMQQHALRTAATRGHSASSAQHACEASEQRTRVRGANAGVRARACGVMRRCGRHAREHRTRVRVRGVMREQRARMHGRQEDARACRRDARQQRGSMLVIERGMRTRCATRCGAMRATMRGAMRDHARACVRQRAG